MFIKYLKNKMPNVYQIIVALAIGLWFDGINMITHSLFDQKITTGIIFICISLFIFYMDDGSLNELHNIDSKNNKQKNKNNNQKRNHIAAIMSAANNI